MDKDGPRLESSCTSSRGVNMLQHKAGEGHCFKNSTLKAAYGQPKEMMGALPRNKSGKGCAGSSTHAYTIEPRD